MTQQAGRCMKCFMTYMMRLSGENRTGSQAGTELLERARKETSEILGWLGQEDGVRVPEHRLELTQLKTPTMGKGGYPWALSSCPGLEQKRKEELGPWSWQQSNVKNGIRLFRIVPSLCMLGNGIIKIHLLRTVLQTKYSRNKQECRFCFTTCDPEKASACFPLRADNENNKGSSPPCYLLKCRFRYGRSPKRNHTTPGKHIREEDGAKTGRVD